MKVAADVVLHEEAGEAFLLHIGTGQYFGLNKSGLIVWNAIAGKNDPVAQLQATWPNRPADELRADAEGLVNRLMEAGLISEDDEPSP